MARKKGKKGFSFDEQEFLIDFIENFPNDIYDEKNREYRPTPYDHFIQLQGVPKADINRLFLSDMTKAEFFNRIPTDKLSAMVPMVKIYRTLSNGEEILYPINQTQTVKSITTSNEGRGTGVSLKKFSYRDEGKASDLFGNFTGELQLHFQSLEALFMERHVGPDKFISFADLLHTEQQSENPTLMERQAVETQQRYPIKIVYGYAVPDDPENIIFNKSELTAIRNLQQTVFVQSFSYNFNISEAGDVDLTIKVSGNQDGRVMTAIKYDLFMAMGNTIENQVIRSERDRLKRNHTEASKQGLPEPTGNSKKELKAYRAAVHEQKEGMEGIQRKLTGLRTESAKDAWSKLFMIMDTLDVGVPKPKSAQSKKDAMGGRLYYTQLSSDLINSYTSLKKLLSVEGDIEQKDRGGAHVASYGTELKKKINESLLIHQNQIYSDPVTDALAAIENTDNDNKSMKDLSKKWNKAYQNDLTLIPGKDHRINFFFLGDLIEAAMIIIHDRPEIKQGCPPSVSGRSNPYRERMWNDIRVMLGSVLLKDKTNPDKKIVYPLADIPIAFSTFQQFWNRNVLSEQRYSYPLAKFLTDIGNDLVPAAIKPTVLGGSAESKLSAQKCKLYRFTFPAKNVLDEVWKRGIDKRIDVEDMVNARWERGGQDYGSVNKYKEYFYLSPQQKPGIPPGRFVSEINKKAHNRMNGIPNFYIGKFKRLTQIGFIFKNEWRWRCLEDREN